MDITFDQPRLKEEHLRALEQAVMCLETANLAGALSDLTGKPIEEALRKIPKPLRKQIDQTVEKLTLKCLDIAIKSLDHKPKSAGEENYDAFYSGVAGGLGGLLGMASLPLELPVTTILMLRAIANIARSQGEDLLSLESRLACIEVFALSKSSLNHRTNLGYYASRAMLAKLSKDAVRIMSERGVTQLSTSAIGGLASESAARYGMVVSEKVTAGSIPVIGAIGGATLNVIFLKYFKKLAHGHFTVRRLERIYGKEIIKDEFGFALMKLGLSEL